MSEPTTHLTKAAAAMLCGFSEATIQRDRRTGKLPNCSTDPDTGELLVSIADLIAAGRLQPDQVPAAEAVLVQRDAATAATALREEHAAALARIEEMHARIALLDKQIEFLQRLVDRQVG